MGNVNIEELTIRLSSTMDKESKTIDINSIKDLFDQGLDNQVAKVLGSEIIYYSMNKLKFFKGMNELGYNPNTLIEKLGSFAEKMILSDLDTPEKIIGYSNLEIDFSKFSLDNFSTYQLKGGINYLTILKDLGFDLHKIELSSQKVQELTNHFFSRFVKENLDKAIGDELDIKAIADLTAIRDFITPVSEENFEHLQIQNFAAPILACSEDSNFMYAPYDLKVNKHIGGTIFDRDTTLIAPCNIPKDKLTENLQTLIKKGQEAFNFTYDVVYTDEFAQNFTLVCNYNPPVTELVQSFFDL